MDNILPARIVNEEQASYGYCDGLGHLADATADDATHYIVSVHEDTDTPDVTGKAIGTCVWQTGSAPVYASFADADATNAYICREHAAWNYATRNQGYDDTFGQWLDMGPLDRLSYEHGAAGIPTA